MAFISASKGAGELDSKEWDRLLDRLGDDRRCTPILGPELSFGSLAARAGIARAWADDLNFPFEERHDLPRVAQYASTMNSADDAHRYFLKHLKDLPAPDPNNPDDPYYILARLPFPLYLTTNYDSFLFRTLEQCHKKPRQDYCRWKDDLREGPTAFDPPYERHEATPVVFHVYGHLGQPDSLVLTEDDYLDFMEAFAKDREGVVPAPVDAAKKSALLFLGYRLRDLDFRVLLRFLNVKPAFQKKIHLCVQLAEDPGSHEANQVLASVEAFLKERFQQLQFNVYFGSCQQFLSELHQRWKEKHP